MPRRCFVFFVWREIRQTVASVEKFRHYCAMSVDKNLVVFGKVLKVKPLFCRNLQLEVM